MTVRQFAIQNAVSESTVIRWLNAGYIPGAVRVYSLRRMCWFIPQDAVAPTFANRNVPRAPKKAEHAKR